MGVSLAAQGSMPIHVKLAYVYLRIPHAYQPPAILLNLHELAAEELALHSSPTTGPALVTSTTTNAPPAGTTGSLSAGTHFTQGAAASAPNTSTGRTQYYQRMVTTE